MYTLNEILVRKNRDWSLVTTFITVQNCLNNYDLTYVKLTDSNGVLKQYRLNDFYKIRLVSTTVLISDYFTNYNGVMPTPINPMKQFNSPNYVEMMSVWHYGFDANRCQYNDRNTLVNPNFLPDIIITQSEGSTNLFGAQTNDLLFVLNGVIFPYIIDSNKVYIKNGGIYLDYFNFQAINVIDFTLVGGFNLAPINASNVSVFHSDNTCAVLHVNVPKQKGKTPLVMLNGRLRLLDNTYSFIDNNTLTIKLDYSKMIEETVGMPINNLNWVAPASTNGTGLVVSSINPITYISSTYCAIIFVNTDQLSIHVEPLLRSGFAGQYSLSHTPHGLVYLSDGSLSDYAVTSVTQYGLEVSTQLPKALNMLKDTTPLQGTVDTSNVYHPSDYTSANLITLYTI